MKVNVYSKTGETRGEIDLPAAFETPQRPDLIRKAVNAAQANRRQPYGSDPMAGKKHSEYSWRSGQGRSRVPRLSQGSTAVLSPAVVGGRRAHPPKVDKDWSEKVNRKERRLAFAAALAATADPATVAARGHRFKEGLTLPLVVEDDLEAVAKTQELAKTLEALGVGDDLARADDGKKQRPGRGKLRGRRYKTPRSVLIVTADGAAVAKAAGNLTGVDVTSSKFVNTELLAPGGDPGRLTIITKSALEQLGERLNGGA